MSFKIWHVLQSHLSHFDSTLCQGMPSLSRLDGTQQALSDGLLCPWPHDASQGTFIHLLVFFAGLWQDPRWHHRDSKPQEIMKRKSLMKPNESLRLNMSESLWVGTITWHVGMPRSKMARNAMGTRRATLVNSGWRAIKGTPAERHQEFRNVADMLRYVKGPMIQWVEFLFVILLLNPESKGGSVTYLWLIDCINTLMICDQDTNG